MKPAFCEGNYCDATGVVALPDWKQIDMRDYSPEELDVMAEAYDRLADRVPQISSPEITLRLVEEIALAVASGERDEAALADAALERANLAV